MSELSEVTHTHSRKVVIFHDQNTSCFRRGGGDPIHIPKIDQTQKSNRVSGFPECVDDQIKLQMTLRLECSNVLETS